MKYYRDFYKSTESDDWCFFIGANTSKGFSYADPRLFDETEYKRLYIIKGGPGTGKSSVMIRCKNHFEALGAHVTSYYCSSDPDSLDAVIIKLNGQEIAIADGTSPHTLDATLPGTVSEIINLGQYWDTDKLKSQYLYIAKSTACKALAFDRARNYLISAGEILTILRKSARHGFDEAKAHSFIRRLISNLPKPKNKTENKNVITSAISMKGAFRLTTLEHAETVIAISDFASTDVIFLEALSYELEKAGYSQTISRSPFGEIDGILLPELNISFVPHSNETVYDKIIRLSRFADKDYFSSCTEKRRFNERCLMEILDGALNSLAEAKEYHFELEKIYSSAMDFKKIDDMCKRLIEEIESYL